MFSINALSSTFTKPFVVNPRNFSFAKFFVTACSSISNGNPDAECCGEQIPRRTSGFSGTNIEETVNLDSGKLRIDTWIASRINGISRARVQSSIRSGSVIVNGQVISKVSHMVKDGDKVNCTVTELQQLRAEPEEMPLDIVYEDEHVLVVNKPAHMVVHPAPGNPNGTLVNGVLHHCRLSSESFLNQEALSDADDDFSISEGYDRGIEYGSNEATIRPGIVHRLDKGTSGLLVIAKNELSHAHLAEQFKKHTINRVYVSLTCGVPSPLSGVVDIPIGRDANNRIRMIAVPGSDTRGKARNAISRYKVIEVFAGAGCALVEWRLQTGRTHQIRAHAKYLGVPLMGDDIYGGTKSMALSRLLPKNPSKFHGELNELVSKLERPCLHAFSLGFEHPYTREHLRFSQIPPPDFAEILDQLRNLGVER